MFTISVLGVKSSDAGNRGMSRGAIGPPIYSRSVNPIQTLVGRLSPPITTGTPKVCHLPASLKSDKNAKVHHK